VRAEPEPHLEFSLIPV